MTVQVAVEKNVTALEGAFHHQLGVVLDGEEFTRRADPLPIKVLTHQRASVVAHDHTVRIQKWHNFKYESVPQKLRLVVITD